MSTTETKTSETLLVPEMRRMDALNKLALALCETLTPEEVDARNEQARQQHFERRANV